MPTDFSDTKQQLSATMPKIKQEPGTPNVRTREERNDDYNETEQPDLPARHSSSRVLQGGDSDAESKASYHGARSSIAYSEDGVAEIEDSNTDEDLPSRKPEQRDNGNGTTRTPKRFDPSARGKHLKRLQFDMVRRRANATTPGPDHGRFLSRIAGLSDSSPSPTSSDEGYGSIPDGHELSALYERDDDEEDDGDSESKEISAKEIDAYVINPLRALQLTTIQHSEHEHRSRRRMEEQDDHILGVHEVARHESCHISRNAHGQIGG